MGMQEIYAKFNGDYEGVLGRLLKEDRIEKYFNVFLQDTLIDNLKAGLENEDFDAMFMAAHTMKGNSHTLGFTDLFNSSYALTEALRAKDYSNIQELTEAVLNDYAAIEAAAA